MALSIVRHDTTKIKADAIVNSTNEYFLVDGMGVDASIHYAAGPKLKEVLEEIEYCPVGSSIVTDSFNIPTCKYIIHAVPPIYKKGDIRVRKLLFRTYYNVLKIAYEKKCKSVAIPLLSAGSNGFPIKEAYEIATSSIRIWLSGHYTSEMEIMLVLYERDTVDLSKSIDHSLYEYITDHYIEAHEEALNYFYDNHEYRREQVNEPNILEAPSTGRTVCGIQPTFAAFGIENYADVDLSFAEMCEWWCLKKGIKKGEFFSASNITRATFSNMKLHPDRAPKKNTVFACAIGLKLDIDQAKDLIMRAGLTFSKHFPTDRLVEQCIRNKKYNIDEINLALHEMGLMLLGYYKQD